MSCYAKKMHLILLIIEPTRCLFMSVAQHSRVNYCPKRPFVPNVARLSDSKSTFNRCQLGFEARGEQDD
jgi:hypothetical protein